jgi:hypothetical protein
MVRADLLERLERLRGRADFMDLQSGQLINHIQKAGMVPNASDARRDVERFGTYRFCRQNALPMRSFADAMKAVPNLRASVGLPPRSRHGFLGFLTTVHRSSRRQSGMS